MTFEIFRCGTVFCWRLLDAKGSLVCEGSKSRRQRQQVEEDVLTLMDKISDAHLVDKTQTSSPRSDKTTDGKRARAGA